MDTQAIHTKVVKNCNLTIIVRLQKIFQKETACFSNLSLINNLASVSETEKCQDGYVGHPPYCRPECVLNSDCLPYVSCINGKCQDPCENGCGENADCKVIRHRAVCSCKENTVGNPYTRCNFRDDDDENEDDTGKDKEMDGGKDKDNGGNDDEGHGGGGRDEDHDDETGHNTGDFDDDMNRGKDQDDGGHDGDNNGGHDVGHGGGHHGENTNGEGQDGGQDGTNTSDFDDDMNRGKDKDDGGSDGGRDHETHGGNDKDHNQGENDEDCDGQKCGQFAKCVRRYGQKSCQCLDGFSGTPPFCNPQCRQDYDCHRNQECISGKCRDKTNIPDNGGNDKDRETDDDGGQIDKDKTDEDIDNDQDCNGRKCGQFATCVQRYSHKSCQCLDGYSGTPPLCRPQCRQNYDCNRNQACISGKCQDSCSGACGLNAKCTSTNHLPRCFCHEGYEGDPYEQCYHNIPPVPEDQTYQNDTVSCPKCGYNAQCEIREEGSSVSCKCMNGFLGDPQTGCRPECILSSECKTNEACIDKRCQDPCSSTCGVNAKCSVVNHFAVCTCLESYSGNPFKICTKIDDNSTFLSLTALRESIFEYNALSFIFFSSRQI